MLKRSSPDSVWLWRSLSLPMRIAVAAVLAVGLGLTTLIALHFLPSSLLPTRHESLATAIRRGDTEELRARVAEGITPEEGARLLRTAAFLGKTEAMALLLANGAPPDGTARSGSPLWVAAEQGHRKAVQLLLSAGADPNVPSLAESEQSPLAAAAMNGHEGIVRDLLEAGANVNDATQAGFTALDAAKMAPGDKREALARVLRPRRP